jgi:hypothetical protein
MSRDQMLDDLAYARTLAEEGRSAPLVGGAYLVLFGVMLAVCYVLQWAALVGALPGLGTSIGAIWAGFGIAAMVGVALVSRRVRNLPGGTAVPNRVDRAVWHGVTAAILVVVAGTVSRAILTGDVSAPNAIVAAGFGLYGVALYATATVGDQAWLRGFAVLAWGVSALLWFFQSETWLYLLAAGGCAGVLIAPGLIMMRREPSTTV